MVRFFITLFGILIGSIIYFTEPLSSSYIASHYVSTPFVAPVEPSKQELKCLTEAIYYESGNQPPLGKEAVAAVIMNRVRDRRYPSTICRVVYQAAWVDGKKICQFSFTCFARESPHYPSWKESKLIAQRVLQNRYHHAIVKYHIDQALWFHAEYVSPAWNKKKEFLIKIGQHLFYRD